MNLLYEHTYIWKLQKRVNQRKGRIDCYRDKIRRRWARGRVECSRGGEENKQARSQLSKRMELVIAPIEHSGVFTFFVLFLVY